MKKKNILITGSNGFVGRSLVKELFGNDTIQLTLLGRNFSSDIMEIVKNSPHQLLEVDLNDVKAVNEACTNIDFVYHLASSSVPATSWGNERYDIETNLLPSLNLLNACAMNNVKKIVFPSSGGAVYGNSTTIMDEKNALNPFSPYGIVKASLEYFLEYYRIKNNLNYTVFRISNIYGGIQNKEGFGVINTWLNKVRKDEPVQIFGDGEAKKDYVFIDDVIEVMKCSLNWDVHTSETYNLCSGRISALNEILDNIRVITKLEIELDYVDSSQSDNKFVQLSNRKLITKMNDFRFIQLKEGIKMTWESMRCNDDN